MIGTENVLLLVIPNTQFETLISSNEIKWMQSFKNVSILGIYTALLTIVADCTLASEHFSLLLQMTPTITISARN